MRSGSAYEHLVKNQRDIPDSLMPPDIPVGYHSWLDAFWELSTDRQLGGMGSVGPIPRSSIQSHTLGWPADLAELFRCAIRAMDKEFLSKVTGERAVVESPQQSPTSSEETKTDNPARDNFRSIFKR